MSYIVQKKINNTVYVYEVTSYRDKKTRKVKNKWKILGKLDDDGVLISSKRKLPGVIKEVKTVRKRFIFEPLK